MPPTEQKDTRLETIITLLESSPTRKEFDDTVEQLAKFVLDLKQVISEIERTYKALVEKVGNDNSSSLEELKSQVNELFVSGQLQEIRKYLDNKVDEKLATIENGNDGLTPTKEELTAIIKPLIPPPQKAKDGSPDTPAQVRDKLEELKDDERLDASAIKGLDKRLKKIESRGSYSGGGFSGRDIIKSYDLSSFLDGVTKTFNIPANWTILEISGTSFPFRFRRLVDYTFTPQTVTFTSEITASASLASGQTVEILYVSG